MINVHRWKNVLTVSLKRSIIHILGKESILVSEIIFEI